MNSPLRRIIIFPISRQLAEVLILGSAQDTVEIARITFAVLRAWRGFSLREDVGIDDGCRMPIPLGMCCALGAEARHSDATAEVLAAIRECRDLKAIRWSGGNEGSDSALGLVGTW